MINETAVPSELIAEPSHEEIERRHANARTKDGELKSVVGRRDKIKLRERAAEIAVDMEEHRYVDPRTSKPWQGSYSKSEIAVAMGYSKPIRGAARAERGGSNKYPAFLREPEFGRYVDWERFKRVAHSNMSPDQMRPTINMVASALSMELVKRALLSPEAINNRELLQETRKYVEMAIGMAKGDEKPGDVHSTINMTIFAIDSLPPSARAIARELFDGSIAKLTKLASPRAIEARAS